MTAPVPRPGNESIAGRRDACKGMPYYVPTPARRNALGYLVARFARIHGLGVSSVVMLDNVWYLSVNDAPQSRLSAFLRDVNARYAEFHHARYGTSGKIVSAGPPGKAVVLDSEAQMEALVRRVTAPVDLGWVDAVADWPGVLFTPEDVGALVTYRRPVELRHFTSYREAESVRVSPTLHDRGRPHRSIARDFKRTRKARVAALLAARPPGTRCCGADAILNAGFDRPAPLHERRPGNGARDLVLANDDSTRRRAERAIASFRAEHRACFDRWVQDHVYVDDWPPGTDYHHNIHGFPLRPG